MDRCSVLLFNIFINSALAFFTAALLIEGTIFLLRIRQGRCAAVLRMIPMLKLPLDLFLYDFTKWAYLHGINPLLCEKGSRTLSATIGLHRPNSSLLAPLHAMIQCTVFGDKTFTVADLLSYFLSPFFLGFFALILLGGSLLCVGKKGKTWRQGLALLPRGVRTPFLRCRVGKWKRCSEKNACSSSLQTYEAPLLLQE